jgi:hypothetical protein
MALVEGTYIHTFTDSNRAVYNQYFDFLAEKHFSVSARELSTQELY